MGQFPTPASHSPIRYPGYLIVVDTETFISLHAPRLKRFFLVPLAVILVAMTSLLVWQHQAHIAGDIDHDAERLRTVVSDLLRGGISDNVHTLGATMQAIHTDPHLIDAFARKDRTELLARSTALFQTLRNNYGITHWYFTGPDRVNILRVHQPERFGDSINRYTTRHAEQTHAAVHGIELGPLGTFTLRYVEPWYQGTKLLGYVELGIEIDHILKRIQELTNTRMYLLINKRYLQRGQWEAGMAMLGRPADWNQLPDEVISIQATPLVEPQLLSAFTPHGQDTTTVDLKDHRVVHRLITEPVEDASGNPVARLVALLDISRKTRESAQNLYTAVVTGSVATLILLALFYFLLSKVEAQLAGAELSLHDLATHDTLTGLYNLRSFHAFMDDEIERSKRSTSPFSLLMIDIDHFKRINDHHGHQTGDDVLRHLCYVLKHNVRNIDRLCRYGGEEFVAILPNSGLKPTLPIAERIRAALEAAPYEAEHGEQISVTVSIGVATYPDHGLSDHDLVSAADSALYHAKRDGRNQVRVFEMHP